LENGDRVRMILLVQINNHRFHYLEFVKPIEDILIKNNFKFKSIQYKNISKKDLKESKKIIISGTSLKDNSFLNDIEKFNWIKDINKPILAICGGMHILGLIFNGKLKKQQEIGLKKVDFKKEFFDFFGVKEVYELHNFYVESSEYDIIALSKNCPQAIKHKNKNIYGVLFHPEVRNKDLIINFINQIFS
jgi:GMP synthase (glutamine-hydrolysing)